jgi:hypothetical protein
MIETENNDNQVISNNSSSSNKKPLKKKNLRWLVFIDGGQIKSVQNRFKELDLAMDIPNKKKFVNCRSLDEKGKAAKANGR